jgi:hypothetical protein
VKNEKSITTTYRGKSITGYFEFCVEGDRENVQEFIYKIKRRFPEDVSVAWTSPNRPAEIHYSCIIISAFMLPYDRNAVPWYERAAFRRTFWGAILLWIILEVVCSWYGCEVIPERFLWGY